MNNNSYNEDNDNKSITSDKKRNLYDKGKNIDINTTSKTKLKTHLISSSSKLFMDNTTTSNKLSSSSSTTINDARRFLSSHKSEKNEKNRNRENNKSSEKKNVVKSLNNMRGDTNNKIKMNNNSNNSENESDSNSDNDIRSNDSDEYSSSRSDSDNNNSDDETKNDSNKKKFKIKESYNDLSDGKSKESQSEANRNRFTKMNELEILYAFMNKFKNESKKKSGLNLPYTHTMTYEPYGSYNIPENMYSKFLKVYEDAIVAGYQPHIVEKHKDFGPIVIDFDFIQSKEHSKRYYTEKTVTKIILTYNKVIRKFLNVRSNQMDAYVCEKKEPVLRKGEYHDGIHIVYPYICTKPNLQLIMREEFLKLAKLNNIFKDIPLANTLENVFDKGVIYYTNWMLYGSRKNKASHVYYVTHIYSTANEKVYDTLVPGGDMMNRQYIRHFINVLSCRRFSTINELTPLADGVDPLQLEDKINDLKDKIIEASLDKKEQIAALMGQEVNFINAVSEETLMEARNLVRLFSKERATNYYSWYQVGKCLHNIDYRLLSDWIEFSKKCPSKFKQGECEALWKKMKPSNYTMATLNYFASKDNPEMYLKLKEEKVNKLVHNGMDASHRSIAKLIMEKCNYLYRCASIKHNIWYEYRNHRWVKIDSAYTLRNRISEELTELYSNKQAYLYSLANKSNDSVYDKNKYFDETIHISKVIKKINDSGFKKGVINECADIAHDPKFLEILDENIYLICFENGVYDLEADKFREGCPDDYVSLCTRYNYIEYDENDEISKDIDDFLKKIQPDNVMREYLMTLLSTCLAGSIYEENFYVFSGSGANGKSKLMELMKYTLGDLYKPMDIRLLTEKRACSSSASPEVADKKGIRACTFDEPKATDEINTGFMKLFTGGDTIMARALFQEPIYFKPQFKPFLLCNQLPKIKADDDGTWRRLKVIPFQSKFIKKSEATKHMLKNGLPENTFWADTKLSEKLPEWNQVFMGKLLKYYRKYRKEGLVHPKIVTEETDKYRRSSDVYQDFLRDYLEETKNEKDIIPVIKLYHHMRDWYKSNYEGKCPNTKDLRNYLFQRVPQYNKQTDSLTKFRVKPSNLDNTMDELEQIKL